MRVGTALDREAYRRGNSTYFPDRVSPMLPEHLSADLCSLKEKELRETFAVEIFFSANGHKTKHRFIRGKMRSAAKLSYRQAQEAIDGNPDDKTQPLLEEVLKPLWAAYAAVAKARNQRAPLDLDRLPSANSVHATFNSSIQTILQCRLIDIVLILPNANRFWVNFDQFCQRVCQPASDRNRATNRNIIIRKFISGNFRC